MYGFDGEDAWVRALLNRRWSYATLTESVIDTLVWAHAWSRRLCSDTSWLWTSLGIDVGRIGRRSSSGALHRDCRKDGQGRRRVVPWPW
jgi:hypothetical protein